VVGFFALSLAILVFFFFFFCFDTSILRLNENNSYKDNSDKEMRKLLRI